MNVLCAGSSPVPGALKKSNMAHNLGIKVLEVNLPDDFGNCYVEFDFHGAVVDNYGNVVGGRWVYGDWYVSRYYYYHGEN